MTHDSGTHVCQIEDILDCAHQGVHTWSLLMRGHMSNVVSTLGHSFFEALLMWEIIGHFLQVFFHVGILPYTYIINITIDPIHPIMSLYIGLVANTKIGTLNRG